jgi:preprotein translocase subunit SecE
MSKKMPIEKANAQTQAQGASDLAGNRMETQKPAVSQDAKSDPKKANKTKKASDKPNIFKRMWKGIKGIFSELKKVTWPKGPEVAKSAAVVLVVVVGFFIVLFGIDYVLAGLLNLIVNGEWSTIFI